MSFDDHVREFAMAPEENPPNPLFKLVVVVSAVFILTILLMIVTALGSNESPLVRFFNDHGLTLVGIEVGSLLFLIIAAMALDRRQTLAAMELASAEADSEDSSAGRNQPEAKVTSEGSST